MLFYLMARILRYFGIQPNHQHDRLMLVTSICVITFFVLLYIVMR
jgi:hypothetical protein